MASADSVVNGSPTSIGVHIRSQEDVNRVVAQIRKREETLKVATEKIKMREARLIEAQETLKKRNDFLDAWEVGLRNKEAETTGERKELENLKASLRKIGKDLLALSVKTESVFGGAPYEDDIIEDLEIEEAPEKKKSVLGFLKGGRKNVKAEPPEVRVFGKPSGGTKKTTLRETLEAKRDKLRAVSIDTSQILGVEEGQARTCPNCGEEVSEGQLLCLTCDTELT
ncbi:MAG: hypothetical protein KAW09_11615 [Thermoplasmata archaeon]|nr:hypothetical protein [Thermoplasmata archaeon]